MRIENREIRRHKCLDQVRAVADGGAAKSDWQRIERVVTDRAVSLLINDREDCHHCRDQDQWHFFDEEPDSGSIDQRPTETPERPKVEEEQHEWERYSHWFRHVRKEENEAEERKAATVWPGRIQRIGPDCSEEEQAIEDVFPGREPSDCLHVKRMNEKQRCDQATAQVRAE